MRMIIILFSLLYSSALLPLADCFLSTKTPIGSSSTLSFQKMSSSELHPLQASASDEMGDVVNVGSLEIVLFGLGDLRVNDHEGLVRAMERARAGGNNAKVLPMFVLDDASLMSFPGARTALYDSATMVSSAIRSLDERLRVDLNLGPLQVCFGDTRQCVEEISSQFQGDTTVHVCDLGTVDNSLGYGSYARLAQSYGDFSFDLRPWMCQLRDEPWGAVYGDDDSFPDSYPRFKKLFGKKKVNRPIPLPEKVGSDEGLKFSPYPLAEEAIVLPSAKDVADRFILNMYESESPKIDLELERSTGLFGTHWGGINGAVCDEKDIMLGLKAYKKVCGDDSAMLQSKWYSSKNLQKNKRSLEHSAISWMSNGFTSSSNLIEGELMVRYLSAPLLLGCVSSRQLWYSTPDDETLLNSISLSSNPLRDMAEASEWHKLFASWNINQDERNFGYDDDVTNVGSVKFGYWRWQGFLCRYVVSRIREKSPNESALLLVHGFGASGSQWSKNMHELSNYAEKCMLTEGPDLAYAPDLIGFGQSEKPAVTYTQYLWESYTQAFIKEICQGKFSSGDFIVGGNSIGGYTAMGSAADDMVSSEDANFVSCSGAPGSGSCKGVFLMNSAGQINPKEMELENTSSVAELTATGKLPPCSPPPRPIASIFGRGLLWYLRPRISSICVNLYPTNPAAVDDNLCSQILRDSLDPGAVNVMISGSKLPKPRTVNDLLNGDYGTLVGNEQKIRQGQWKGPVRVIHGMLDPLQNPNDKRVEGFVNLRQGIDPTPINCGHCPHDELPADCAVALHEWIQTTFSSKTELLV